MMATGTYGGDVRQQPPPSQPSQQPPQQYSNNYGNGVQQAQQQQPNQSTRPVDLRVILSRDEVAFLFGFDGSLISQLRQQTGAHVQITDGDSFEYVLLISGSIEVVFKAFSLVCRGLWDLLTNIAGPGHNRPLKIRIAVPAVQCGSIIGKAGAKVKEIRDMTGAQIQVSHEPLPNSSERCVEISGSGESCLQCTYQICCVMQEAPLRGEVVPYIPPVNNQAPMSAATDTWRPVFLCGDKAYIIEGQMARPAPPELLRKELAKTPFGSDVADIRLEDHMNPLNLVAAISRNQQNGAQTSQEMKVSSDLIQMMMNQGQGQKIEEIKRMSGAQIHISDQQSHASGEHLITLSGSQESILLAQFLVQSNLDLASKEKNQQTSQNNLYPTNQFDPSILQQNFDFPQQQEYNNSSRGGAGGGQNFRQQNIGGSNNDRYQGSRGAQRGRRSPDRRDHRGGGGRRGGGSRR